MTDETQEQDEPGLTPHEQVETEKNMKRGKITAELMTRPSFMAAHTAMSFVPNSMTTYGSANILTMFESFRDSIKKVTEGDMTTPEAILISQAMSLSSIYNECASQAALNLGSRSALPAAESLMRMALKAQSQCTQTLRVLGELKAPKQVSFEKQQNVAAGNQQVNNGVASPAHAHGEQEKAVVTNELLADDTEAQHAATLDIGAKGGAGREDQTLEAVGAVDRTKDA